MGLSEELRDELARVEPARECDRLAELSALFHTAGSVHLQGGRRLSVHLDLASSAVARRAFALLRAEDVDSEIRSYQQHAFGRATRYQLHVEGSPETLALLTRAGALGQASEPIERPPKRVVARACCRAAYLRGALLGAGSLSGPPSLHLEIRTAGPAGATFLAELAAREGIHLGAEARDRHARVYAKGADAVAETLAFAGASQMVLVLAERSVIGQTRADANRLANADHANLVRTTRAAHAQLEAVRLLRASGELDRLPDELREAAALRLGNPLASLAELARKGHLSKPALQRRLRTLQDRAGVLP